MSGLRERVVALARDLYEASAGHYGAPSLAECEALALAAAREALAAGINFAAERERICNRMGSDSNDDLPKGSKVFMLQNERVLEAFKIKSHLTALSAALSAPKEGA